MAGKLPWMKFFPADWLSDEKLRACSIETRGLWIDILSHMHKNDRRGYLQLNGSPVSLDQLARMTGCSTEQATRCVAELLDSGVASALADGTLYSRRMLREEQKRGLCSEAGQKGGGNPALRVKIDPPLKVGQADPGTGQKVGQFDPPLKDDPKVGLKVGIKVGPKVPLISDSYSEGQSPVDQETKIDTVLYSGGGGAGGGGKSGSAFKRGSTPEQCPDFMAFWRAYPRRQKRQAAFKVWQRLDVDDELLAVILRAVSRQSAMEGWRKENGKYVPLPTTWLNGQEWENELHVDLPAVAEPVPSPSVVAAHEAIIAAQVERERQAKLHAEQAERDRLARGGNIFAKPQPQPQPQTPQPLPVDEEDADDDYEPPF